MDDIDRRILTILQKEFPLDAEPYRVIGERVGLTGEDVLRRVTRLRDEGIIRRIGAVFDVRKLGYASTLCAARVPEEKIEDFVAVVNSYRGVTHNYRRGHTFNVWFTFIAPSMAEIEQALEEIKDATGVDQIIIMPATRTFKIDASFDLT
jgi:DNA-binding Lrp family transcriptional regulator